MDKMDITSAQYVTDTLTGDAASITAVIGGVTMSVPLDPANRHYQEYLKWVAEGNQPLPADGE